MSRSGASSTEWYILSLYLNHINRLMYYSALPFGFLVLSLFSADREKLKYSLQSTSLHLASILSSCVDCQHSTLGSILHEFSSDIRPMRCTCLYPF